MSPAPGMDASQRTERPGSPAPIARPPQAVFAWCPMCDGRLEPEHAHYRCTECAWRDSCCD